MDNAGLVTQARRILGLAPADCFRAMSEAKEFLRVYAGAHSSFYQDLANIPAGSANIQVHILCMHGAMEGFIAHVENDLLAGMSPERRAQIDVVSDFLEQAHHLLENKDMHPAASAMITGCALEEFLRNWVEAEGIQLGSKKPSIDTYCNRLREAELIEKQDVKDVTSWAGLRNHAAHGEWEAVSDRAHVNLMLKVSRDHQRG